MSTGSDQRSQRPSAIASREALTLHLQLSARTLAAGVTAGALAAPPAVARPIGLTHTRARGDGRAPVVEREPARADVLTVVRSIDSGFDWGSAAIGAGGAGALVVLVSLGGFAYASRDHMQGHVVKARQNKMSPEQRRDR